MKGDEEYIVRYGVYKYNTGNGHCGEKSYSETFDNERDAILFHRKISSWMKLVDKPYDEMSRVAIDEMEDFIYDHVDDGYISQLRCVIYKCGNKEVVLK